MRRLEYSTNSVPLALTFVLPLNKSDRHAVFDISRNSKFERSFHPLGCCCFILASFIRLFIYIIVDAFK